MYSDSDRKKNPLMVDRYFNKHMQKIYTQERASGWKRRNKDWNHQRDGTTARPLELQNTIINFCESLKSSASDGSFDKIV